MESNGSGNSNNRLLYWILLGGGLGGIAILVLFVMAIIFLGAVPAEDLLDSGLTMDQGVRIVPEQSAPSDDVLTTGPARNGPSRYDGQVGTAGVTTAGTAATAPLLEYRFNEDEVYSYGYDIEIDLGSNVKQMTGIIGFVPSAGARVESNPESREGTGTAWAVSKDGYLVTCAHVVDGATSVELSLNGKQYAASVVASDNHLDLALLKINAIDLTPLELASTTEPEIGSEVRAVGFPLSDLLGSSAKVTRGTISGNVVISGRKLAQVDCSINPGNSGGPVVDLTGSVIGVASEKLSGQSISNVGFCIPVSELKSWLNGKVRLPAKSANRSEMSGPELARQVIPSVAMVRVTLGAPVSASVFKLSDFSSSGSGSVFRSLRPGQPSVTIDSFGQILEMDDCEQLPFLLGPIVTLPIIPLPGTNESNWGAERNVPILQQEDDSTGDAFADYMRRRMRPFGDRDRQVKVINARETDQYRISSSSGNEIRIERSWRIVTEDSPPTFDSQCNLVYKFNQELGIIETMEGNGTFRAKRGPLTVELPVKVSFSKLNVPAGGRDVVAGAPGAVTPGASGSTANGSSNAPKIPEAISNRIANLTSSTSPESEKISALEFFAETKSTSGSREAVVDALVQQLDSKQEKTLLLAIKALTEWDVATRVTEVSRCLSNNSREVRLAAIKYAMAMQDAAAGPELLKALKDPTVRDEIYSAFRSIGTTVEPSVLKMLKDSDEQIRVAGCEILADIGSEKSVAELRRLAKNDSACQAAAKKALKALGQSVTEKPSAPTDDDDVNPFETKPRKK